MIRGIFIVLLLTFQFTARAQGSLQFCDKIDDKGKPNVTFESLILSPEGQKIYLLYHSEKGPLADPKIKVEIAQLKNHNFQKTDLLSVFADPTKEFLSIPYQLKTEGDYRFRIIDGKGTLLAEEILSVSVEMTEAGTIHEKHDSPGKISLPDHVDLRFSSDGPDSYNTEFSFRATKGKVNLSLEPFDESSGERIIEIWQSEGGDYKQFIRSEKVTFIKSDDAGIYNLSFPAMKDYKVNIFNTENILLTSGFVSFK